MIKMLNFITDIFILIRKNWVKILLSLLLTIVFVPYVIYAIGLYFPVSNDQSCMANLKDILTCTRDGFLTALVYTILPFVIAPDHPFDIFGAGVKTLTINYFVPFALVFLLLYFIIYFFQKLAFGVNTPSKQVKRRSSRR